MSKLEHLLSSPISLWYVPHIDIKGVPSLCDHSSIRYMRRPIMVCIVAS